MKKQKITFSWSGGKDSALALFKLLQSEKYEVVSLHTSFDKQLKRVGMHGTPEVLIEQQAASIGLPLEKLYLDKDASHESYEKMIKTFCLSQKEKGITTFAYGDIFLEDLKSYREKQLASEGLEAIFPLWQMPTQAVANEFLASGFNTILCCLNAELLPKEFLGKPYGQIKEELSALVDPCGENGEFHSFVFEGPIFKKPVVYSLGEQIMRSYDVKKEVDGNVVSEKHNYWFQEINALS